MDIPVPVSVELSVRLAVPEDVLAIVGLIDYFAEKNLLLRRSRDEVLLHIGDFVVAEHTAGASSRIIGCASLYRYDAEVSELRSLCVREDFRGMKVARRLTERLIKMAQEQEICRMLLFTVKAGDFFERLGFIAKEKSQLAAKVVNDCSKCVCYGNCPAQVYELEL